MDFLDNEKFYSFKKVLLFGSEGSGKSTLTNWLNKGIFQENIIHTEGGNIIN